MTDVYLAFDTQQERRAVLKIVEESSDPLTHLVVEAERRGAELQRKLHEFDSRVIEIYEFGAIEGCFFVAMEYVEGRNVAGILRAEKSIEPRRAAEITAEICSQLDRLHSFTAELDGQRRAVVHGDIKPSNIQIGLRNEVRLLDFGIAKAITFTHNLTHHNFGSPNYCSPERLRNAQVDHHADLWAVGVTLYEMVAGMPPYQAQSTRKLEAVIQSRRPPRPLPENCPLELQAILQKALAGDLARRYLTAAAFYEDLMRFLHDQPTVASNEGRALRNNNATVEKNRMDRTTVDRPRPQLEAPRRFVPAMRAARRWVTGLNRSRVASALGLFSALLWGLLTGFLLCIPAGYFYRLWSQSEPLRAHTAPNSHAFNQLSLEQINSDWTLYQRLLAQTRWMGRFSPATKTGESLRAGYLTAADDVIDSYRTSSDSELQDFNWPKAQICLRHVLDLDPGNRAAQGKLALVSGYMALRRNDSDEAARKFQEAEKDLPRSPDPHLGMGRIAVYSLHNAGKAVAEFHEAEALGAHIGPREMEQEADVYRYRAGQELSEARQLENQARRKQRLLELAQHDFERARQLYEPILGFANVDMALSQLDDDDRSRQQLAEDLNRPPKPVLVRRKLNSRLLRWR